MNFYVGYICLPDLYIVSFIESNLFSKFKVNLYVVRNYEFRGSVQINSFIPKTDFMTTLLYCFVRFLIYY